MGATYTEEWTIRQLIENVENKLIFIDKNQRNSDLHNKRIKSTILNTLLTPINRMSELTFTKNDKELLAIDDGQQRINDVIEFVNDGFTFNSNSLPPSIQKDMWCMHNNHVTFSQLTPETKEYFLNGKVNIVIIEANKLGHISTDYSFNSQNIASVNLNGDETLHGAYYGKFLDFIKSNFTNKYLNEIGYITPDKIKRLTGLRPLISMSEQYISLDYINSRTSNLEDICISRRNMKIPKDIKNSIKNAVKSVEEIFPAKEMKKLKKFNKVKFFNILVVVIGMLDTYVKDYNKKLVKKALIKLHNDLINDHIQDESDTQQLYKKQNIIKLIYRTLDENNALATIKSKENITRAMFEYISFESKKLKADTILIGKHVAYLNDKVKL